MFDGLVAAMRKIATRDAEFNEGDHPRGEGGKFAEHAARNTKAAEAHEKHYKQRMSKASELMGVSDFAKREQHNREMAEHHKKAAASHRKASEHYTNNEALRARGHEMSGNVYGMAAKKRREAWTAQGGTGEDPYMQLPEPVSHPKAEVKPSKAHPSAEVKPSKAHPSAEAHESLAKQHEATAKKLTASGNKVGSLIAGVNANFHRKAAEMLRAGHPEAETISAEAHRRTAESNKPSKPTLINPSGRKPGPQPKGEAKTTPHQRVAEAAAKIAPPQKYSEKHAQHAKEHEERAKTAPAGAAGLHRDAQAAHIIAQREAEAVEGNPTANSYQHEKMHKMSAAAHRESRKAHHAEAMLAHSAGNSAESTRQIDLSRFHGQRQSSHEREEQQRQFGRLHEPKK